MEKFLFMLITVMMLSGGIMAGQTTFSSTIGNVEREWIYYVPEDLPESPPLVFCLQGCCSDYRMWVSMSEYNDVADTAKIVVCYPKAINTSIGGQINDRDWDITADRDLDFILALIDTAVEKYNIDRKRIYATGFSYGGCFSNYLACRYPDIFAAIAPSAGYVMTLQLKERTDCNGSRPVPVLHMHGTSDRIVSYTSGVMSVASWVRMNECPEDVQITEHYQGSSTVKMEYYGPCKDNTEVIFLSAEGMDHAWMSESQVGVSAAVESWNFMSNYSLESEITAERVPLQSALVHLSPVARYHAGTISITGIDAASNIRLVAVNGRVVGRWSHIDNRSVLATGMLPDGVYLLNVQNSEGSDMMRLLVH